MTYSRALPEAMGYTVTMDDSAGYGVTRMLIGKAGTMQVWNPRDNSDQCFDVLCWLMAARSAHIDYGSVTAWHADDICDCDVDHNGTPAGLRAAIVEAAERVAKELGRG